MFSYFKQAVLVVSTSLFCITFANSADVITSKQGSGSSAWEKVKEKNGIIVYKQSKATTTRFRGVGRINVYDLYSLVAILDDYEHYPAWFPLVTEISILHTEDYFNRYARATVSFPVIKSREFVEKVIISQDMENQSVTVRMINDYDYIPLNPNYLRLRVFDGLIHFDIISKNEVEMTYEIEIRHDEDFLPPSLLKYLTTFVPYLTIMNLRDVVKDSKYHNLETLSSEIQFKHITSSSD